jgi:hypothetical protein
VEVSDDQGGYATGLIGANHKWHVRFRLVSGRNNVQVVVLDGSGGVLYPQSGGAINIRRVVTPIQPKPKPKPRPKAKPKPAPAATTSTATTAPAAQTVPDVVGHHLNIAEDDLSLHGVSYRTVGGGAFGIVVKFDWKVCATVPGPGEPVNGPVALIVKHFTCL